MAQHDGLLFLTKLAPVFIYPLGLALLLLGAALIGLRCADAPFPKVCLTVAFVLFWMASTPMVSQALLSALENQHPPRPIAQIPSADVAIVLGGAVNGPAPPRVATELGDASDRVLHAARLFKAGKVQRIWVSGGNLPWSPGQVTEAESIQDLLVEWGVPQDRIEVATGSRNTLENAQEIRVLYEQNSIASAYLVTSAFHMPRALAIFRTAGLPVRPATTDVRAVHPTTWTPLDILPDVHVLATTTLVIKEVLGLLALSVPAYLSAASPTADPTAANPLRPESP